MEFEYNIIFRDSANNDLIDISDYIERMTFSKVIATNTTNNIIAAILKLSYFPYMYQVFYKEFRVFSIKNKRIFYKIYEEKKEVVIFRILGGAQNYENFI